LSEVFHSDEKSAILATAIFIESESVKLRKERAEWKSVENSTQKSRSFLNLTLSFSIKMMDGIRIDDFSSEWHLSGKFHSKISKNKNIYSQKRFTTLAWLLRY
jgi:hypothetical protein